MRFALFAGFFLACFVPSVFSGQLPAAKTDPLAKPPAGQAAVACSATEASCAEAAAKILPQVMGPSQLEENLRRPTDEVGGRVAGSRGLATVVELAWCA